jgi:hypothetical protein
MLNNIKTKRCDKTETQKSEQGCNRLYPFFLHKFRLLIVHIRKEIVTFTDVIRQDSAQPTFTAPI